MRAGSYSLPAESKVREAKASASAEALAASRAARRELLHRDRIEQGRGSIGFLTEEQMSSESAEQLSARAWAHEQASSDSATRSLRVAQTARDVGAQTLGQLHAQGEQLRKAKADQQSMMNNLSASDRMLRGMESWKGWLGNLLTGGNVVKTPDALPPPPTHTAPSPFGARTPSQSPRTPSQSQAGACVSVSLGASSALDEDDETLGELGGVVSDLHAQAAALRAEMSNQSLQMGEMVADAQMASERMVNNTARTRALRR